MKEFDEEKAFGMFESFKSDKLNDDDYEKAKSKASFLGALAGDFITLLKMVKSYFSGEFEISKIDLAMIIGAIVYVASPIDALPDFIPVAGFIDDTAIVGFVIKKFKDLIDKYKRELE